MPFIIRWPARIKPGVFDALVNQIDFIASFADLLDIELPANEARDSRNMLEAFLGEDQTGLPFMIEEAIQSRALRRGDWKYVSAKEGWKKDSPVKKELYNLKDDPGEAKNTIRDHPEKADSMELELKKRMESEGVRN